MQKNFILLLLLILIAVVVGFSFVYNKSLNLSLLRNLSSNNFNYDSFRENLINPKVEVKKPLTVPPELSLDTRKSEEELKSLLKYSQKNNIKLTEDINKALQMGDNLRADILLRALLKDKVLRWHKLVVLQGIYAGENESKQKIFDDFGTLIQSVRNNKDINTLIPPLTKKYADGIMTSYTIDNFYCDSKDFESESSINNVVKNLKVKDITDPLERQGYSYVVVYAPEGNDTKYCNFDEFVSNID